MDFNIEVRHKQLQSLDEFITCSRDQVQSILDSLQWNVTDTLKESHLIKCSINPNHRVPLASVDEHIQKCSLNKEGYDESDAFLGEPGTDPSASITIDDYKKMEVLSAARRADPDFKSGWNGQDPDPKTCDRMIATFTSSERLALYDFAIKNTTGPAEVPEFNIFQPVKTEGKTFTEEELLRRERDAKRRRIKYKSVHTNRKNYTEVMREVINGQMDLYSEWVQCNNGVDTGSVSNIERDASHYADSVGKRSSFSDSSSTAAKYSDVHSSSHKNSSDHNSQKHNHRNYSYASEKYYRSHHRSDRYEHRRSRSNDRHSSRKRRRTRSRSRHRHRY